MTKYFLLTQMKYSEEYNFLSHVMASKTFSVYFLLKTKNGLANL